MDTWRYMKGGLVGLLVFPRGEQAQLVRLANETASSDEGTDIR